MRTGTVLTIGAAGRPLTVRVPSLFSQAGAAVVKTAVLGLASGDRVVVELEDNDLARLIVLSKLL